MAQPNCTSRPKLTEQQKRQQQGLHPVKDSSLWSAEAAASGLAAPYLLKIRYICCRSDHDFVQCNGEECVAEEKFCLPAYGMSMVVLSHQ